MKKLFLFLGFIFGLILLAAIALTVYAFAFEKKVPTKYVDKYIDNVAEEVILEDFSSINNLHNFKTKLTYTDCSYSLVDGEAVEAIDEKYTLTIAKTGKDADFVLEVTKVNYDSNDEKTTTVTSKFYRTEEKYFAKIDSTETEYTETEWQTAVALIFLYLPFDENGKLADGAMLADNLDKVVQKGLFITAYASKDNVELEVKIKITTERVALYNKVESTYSGETLTNKVTTKYTITY